jgi:hypothetical protein
MADDKGKPLAAELVASPAPHADTRAEPIPRCKGCGAIHGGVGAERICMRNEIDRLRALVVKLGGVFVVPLMIAALGCGGAEFTVAPPWLVAGDASGIEPAGEDAAVHDPGSDAGDEHFRDANTADEAKASDAPASLGPHALNDGSTDAHDLSDDAGASMRDAGTMFPPDAGGPHALCCATPCSGSQVANIACTGGAWTCGASSCAVGCALGDLCTYMQVCAGHVVECP